MKITYEFVDYGNLARFTDGKHTVQISFFPSNTISHDHELAAKVVAAVNQLLQEADHAD